MFLKKVEDSDRNISLNSNESERVNLETSLAQATVKWIKLIAQNFKEAQEKYPKEKEYLQKGIWYSSDLLKACQVRKQPKMVEFIKKRTNRL